MQLSLKPLQQQAIFIVLITLVFVWFSLPGLKGGFILDDWPNLENVGQVKDIQSLFHYVFNGNSSLLGRPFSLLSFALQAEYWPHNPFPFKLTSLCIHIINAWLIYACCYLIAQITVWPERSCFLFAGSAFGLWLFMPLNISTVFYVVQRMTLLSAFFSLTGVVAFLWGFKLSLTSDKPKNTGLVIATLGIALTYTLGILSKENAILTGLGIAALYFCLLRRRKQNLANWDKWIVVVCILPSMSLLSYLCLHLDQHTRADFTPYQRLITESVILLDYVGKILFPTPYKLNIFNDGFPLYKEIYGSFEASKAVAFWLGLFSLAVFFRKRLPFFAFAVFWYLSGHLLESSVFGLELYFEHRNYLPSLGLIIGIVGTLIDLNDKAQNYSASIQKVAKYTSISLISGLSIIYLLVYGTEVNAWKNPGSLAISALTERPNSYRAHQEAASFFVNQGNFKAAEFLLDKVEKRWPSTGNFAQYLMLKCFDNNVAIPDLNALTNRFQHGGFDRGTLSAFTEIHDLKKQDNCQYLQWEDYLKYIELITGNPAFAIQIDDFLILQAYSYTALKQPENAAHALDFFPDDKADTDYLLYKANFFAVAGNVNKALSVIQYIKAKFGNNLKYQLANQKTVDSIESMLKQSLLENKKSKH